MIEVENLNKSFGDAHVLKGITTSFEKGKTNLIIGQSGSGKTVFMKCLLGLIVPDEGTISYDGRMFSKLSAKEKRNLRMWLIGTGQQKENIFIWNQLYGIWQLKEKL